MAVFLSLHDVIHMPQKQILDRQMQNDDVAVHA
jgi:hypothetical protein